MDLSSAVWRKSTRSGNNGGDCVEVAVVRDRGEEFVVLVRDSKRPEGGLQVFTAAEWNAFLEGVA